MHKDGVILKEIYDIALKQWDDVEGARKLVIKLERMHSGQPQELMPYEREALNRVLSNRGLWPGY